MYADFFDLKSRPFRPNPGAADVFVGPQTARIMKSIRQALATNDAVLAVTGDSGVGKTTLVRRSLDAMGDGLQVVRMPRAQLAHDEVVEYLLEQLKVPNLPAGMLRKVIACREFLAKSSREGRGICIVIEDATRIGEDALVELEALTSSDSGDDHGARLVLLGTESLRDLLNAPALARLSQRTRLRFRVEPLPAAEMLAYLKHCFRLAGGDYDRLFAPDSTALLHRLSRGTPRLVNNLVESVLEAAADRDMRPVTPALIAEIARDQHGMQVEIPADAAEPAATADEPTSTTGDDVDSGSFLINDTLPDLDVLAPELAKKAAQSRQDADEIPTLFSSTRMERPQAAPVVPAASPPTTDRAAPSHPTTPSATQTSDTATEKTLAVTSGQTTPAEAPQVEDEHDVPAWDRDPTLAELRPDIEALEMAMAEFSSDSTGADEPDDDDEDPVIELKDPTISNLPEITLDVAIEEKIREAQDALRKHDETIAEDDVEDAPKAAAAPAPVPKPEPAKVAPRTAEADAYAADLQRVAAGIANAKSLEDVDDRMAETLFGEDFSAIAAQVVANAPQADDAGTFKLELVSDTPETDDDDDDVSADASDDNESESEMEREFKRVYGEDALEVSLQSDAPKAGLDLSASQRLATVRALNAERKLSESARIRGKGKSNGNGAAPPAPTQSIEDQINTSMTQTLRTLAARPSSANDDDDDDDDGRKGGFFSRFRRH